MQQSKTLAMTLRGFAESGEGNRLLFSYRRASRILKEQKWDLPRVMATQGDQGIPQTGEEDPLSMVEDSVIAEAIVAMAKGTAAPSDVPEEEAALTAALDRVEPLVTVALAVEDFEGATARLASLGEPIAAFFDRVSLDSEHPEVRTRRLNILARFREAVQAIEISSL